MQKYCQYIKKGLLYCVIGLSIAGGSYALSSKTAHAEIVFNESGVHELTTNGLGYTFNAVALLNSTTTYGYSVTLSYCFHSSISSTHGILFEIYDSENHPSFLSENTGGIGEGENCGSVVAADNGYFNGTFPFVPSTSYTILFNTNGGNGEVITMDTNDYVFAATNGEEFIPLGNKTEVRTFTPNGGDTAATGTNSIGFTANINPSDWNSNMYWSFRVNAMDTGIPPQPDFLSGRIIATSSGSMSYTNTTTFGSIGRYKATATLWTPSIDVLGVTWGYHEYYASSTIFLVSTTTSFRRVQSIIVKKFNEAVASSSAAIASSCNPLGSFDITQCIIALMWPGSSAIDDDLVILKQTPPWGYVYRVIDLLSTTTTSTTLPSISYSFASSSPMASLGDIHFDPFGTIADSGTLIASMKSDRSDAKDVWQIFMPVINIFIYAVLGFMIIHDLTGIHSSSEHGKEDIGKQRAIKNNNS